MRASDIEFRDRAAIEIMAAIMTTARNMGEGTKQERDHVYLLAARFSYEAADALLAVRHEGPQP